jgi:DNA-binding transcriptional regulator LsrR (DeoR family)
MKRQKVSQAELARRMRTSRAVVHRLLMNAGDVGLTLSTMSKAAAAVGCTVKARVAIAA